MNAYKLPSGGEGLTGAVLTVALWSRPVYFLLALARPPSPQNRAEEGYGYRVRFVFVEGVVSFSVNRTEFLSAPLRLAWAFLQPAWNVKGSYFTFKFLSGSLSLSLSVSQSLCLWLYLCASLSVFLCLCLSLCLSLCVTSLSRKRLRCCVLPWLWGRWGGG